MFDTLQSYSFSQAQATTSVLLPVPCTTPQLLDRLPTILCKATLRLAFEQLRCKYKQVLAHRRSNLAYVFIDRLPSKYRKDMSDIVDYYQKQLMTKSAELQKADIRLQEMRKKARAKAEEKPEKPGFWDVRRLRTLELECQQLKRTVQELQEQLEQERNRKTTGQSDNSCLTTDQSTLSHESALEHQISRLKQELRFFLSREEQATTSMSTLISQLVEHQNIVQSLQEQISHMGRKLSSVSSQNTRLQQQLSELKRKMAQCVHIEEQTALQNQILEGIKNDQEREIRRLKTDVLRMEVGDSYRKDTKAVFMNTMNNLGGIRQLEEFFSPILQEHRHSRSRSKQNCLAEPAKSKFTLHNLKSAIKTSISDLRHQHQAPSWAARPHNRSIL